ncbi:aspartyl-tRNA amidotransferase [bacterium (Candidatus Howlettbacteria) CG_4_10_14_0_8_um_filter_40_9]|nr:MAG: aspartyl-tRNA amidotransferase [bacterium (Candidatus Howlettbacteria) CG_4_10_14_0_8_um_filter_40_9]
MNISKDISSEIVESMKKKEDFKLSTLRLLKSALKNAEIDAKRELTEEEELSIIEKQAKQRREAAGQYKSAGRNDLAEKEEKELEIMEKYLPEKMSLEEVKKIVLKLKEETGATGEADFGKLMGKAMLELKGKADGGIVGSVVKEVLSDK